MKPALGALCLLPLLLLIGASCGGSHRSVTGVQRYAQLLSCLARAGLPGLDRNRGSWPRSLVAMSRRGDVVFADVFRSDAGARRAAAIWSKEEAAYVRRGRAAGIPTPSRQVVLGDRVFARYAVQRRITATAVTSCVRGSP
jgi:hypothetical protein